MNKKERWIIEYFNKKSLNYIDAFNNIIINDFIKVFCNNCDIRNKQYYFDELNTILKNMYKRKLLIKLTRSLKKEEQILYNKKWIYTYKLNPYVIN